MATTITAGNATNGAIISPDNTGILELKTGTGSGTTGLTLDASQNPTFLRPFSKIFSVTASVSSNALTVTLNPCAIDFRSSTLSSGTINTRTVSSAISMTVSSGSTLGTVNNVASRIVIIAIDNAGTVELAVVNIAGGNQLDETNLISTTAEGGAGAADSNNVIYSTTARSSVPYRVVGFIDSTQTTAGTWASAPTTIQGVGGQALTALSSIGYGQTWQSVVRSSGTTYYNTTGKPIVFQANITATSGSAPSLTVSINGGSAIQIGTTANPTAGTIGVNGSLLIPAGASYLPTAGANVSFTPSELR